ncbi:MAG: class I SAM-dependent methyltransferase [Actinomycetota bacterium]
MDRKIKDFYDRIAKYYGMFSIFEGKYRNLLISKLKISSADKVLDIGCGTGEGIKTVLKYLNREGAAYGLDISSQMIKEAERKIKGAEAKLVVGDARKIPFEDGKFDIVILSFTLELFKGRDIDKVLGEAGRVLKKGGKLGILSLSKDGRMQIMKKFYIFLHRKFPAVFNCRPIEILKYLYENNYRVDYEENVKVYLLPARIVICKKGK